jgi:predicted nucleic acid-binding protein
MRILLDTDVVLDVLLARQPFAQHAAKIWQENQDGRVEAYISAITPINVFYIARKLKGLEAAREAIEKLLSGLQICSVDQSILEVAFNSTLTDYEDAVQVICAIHIKLDAIVTRNLEDFRGAAIQVYRQKDC